MPNIIKEYRPQSTSEKFGEAFSRVAQAAGQMIPQAIMEKEVNRIQKEKQSRENQKAKELGFDVEGLEGKNREEAFKLGLQGKTSKQIESKEAETQAKMKDFADQIEMNNPGSQIHKMVADIYRSSLPVDEKSSLVKNIAGIDPYKFQQQLRLRRDSLLKYYKDQIVEFQKELQNKRPYDHEGITEIQNKINAVRAERDGIMREIAEEGGYAHSPEETKGEIEEEAEEEVKPVEKLKPKFDQKNPEHKAKATQLAKKFKEMDGTLSAEKIKEKVKEALKKEFIGL